MPHSSIGSLGTLAIRLSQVPEPQQRYDRRYEPVTPRSQEVPGADAKIAPITTIAQWAINDWGNGEGDLRWQERGQYNISDTAHPTTDGTGLRVGPDVETTVDDGASTFTEGKAMCVSAPSSTGQELYAANYCDGDLYVWDTTNEEWDVFHTEIDAGNSLQIDCMAANNNVVFLVSNGDIYKVTSSTASNLTSAGYDQLGFWGQTLYGVSSGGVYSINQTTGAGTLLADLGLGGNIREGPLRFSDVGPIVVAYDGRVLEYNVADDTASTVGRLPDNAATYDVYWSRDTYYAGFSSETNTELAYLWFKAPTGEGVIGPIRYISAAQGPHLAGVEGDRLYFVSASEVWAYDQSTGGVVHVASLNQADQFSLYPSVVYGDEVFVRTNTTISGSISYNTERLVLPEFDTAGGTLDTGRYDFGYLGLKKILTKVFIETEADAGSDTVAVAYSEDGASFTSLSGTLTGSNSTKEWIVSDNASTISGYNFEFRITITPTRRRHV